MLDFAPSNHTPRFAFGKHDRVTIGGIAYRPVDATDAGYVFVRLDGQGVAESYSRSEIARLVDLGRVGHERDALLPESAKARLAVPSDPLSMLPAKQHRRARRKEATVLSFLEMEACGQVNRTDAAIQRETDAIIGRASRMLKGASQYDDYQREAGELAATAFSPRTLRRWLSAYEDLGISGLYDGISNRGNRERRLCAKSLMLLSNSLRSFMTTRKMTQEAVFTDVKRAFDAENVQRRAEGRPELVRPSKETVRQAILRLDPYQCDVAREGIEYARRKHAPVGQGLDLTRPLQRVEIDTWKVDLITLMTDSGLLHFLSQEDKEYLGLNGDKKRWHLTVAICATTRCIMAMRLSRAPTANATVQVIDMITRDKGFWSDEIGALTPWYMRGTPELIVADCGGEYTSYDTRVVARDLGIRTEHAPAGLPEMRARIERLFSTISVHLMQRLTGRTFSNIIERGDYDSKARAALTVDDLCAALVRWVVDIYHRQPHEGLDGESPARCWDRLTEQYGVAPAADLRRRRVAFGTRMTRTLAKDGLTVLGVRYQSEEFARKVLGKVGTQMNLRWYSEDIGDIEVEIDGEWTEVPAITKGCSGVRAQTWLAARRALRARYKQQAELDEKVVLQAIADIENINGNAMKRVGLLVDDWSEERLKHEEQRLFIGFACRPDERNEKQHAPGTGFGDDLQTASENNHENVSDKDPKSAPSVSGPAAVIKNPPRAERHPSRDDDEGDPGFEIEDK